MSIFEAKRGLDYFFTFLKATSQIRRACQKSAKSVHKWSHKPHPQPLNRRSWTPPLKMNSTRQIPNTLDNIWRLFYSENFAKMNKISPILKNICGTALNLLIVAERLLVLEQSEVEPLLHHQNQSSDSSNSTFYSAALGKPQKKSSFLSGRATRGRGAKRVCH